MIKTYFVDGDKGGVGKSFVSRCLVDSFLNNLVTDMPKIDKLIIVDADPMNPDVVCNDGYVNETVNSIEVIAKQYPINSPSDWLDVINDLVGILNNEDENVRVIFSLPSAAGLHINNDVFAMMKLINPMPIWVMGVDLSSTTQLHTRVDKNPIFYQSGVVLVNLKHGARKSFSHWNNYELREELMNSDNYSWIEIELPGMMPRAAELVGSMPFHKVVEKGSVLGSAVAVGTRTVVESYRGVVGKILAQMENHNG